MARVKMTAKSRKTYIQDEILRRTRGSRIQKDDRKFFYQGMDGVPIGRVSPVIEDKKVKPTVLKQSTFDATDWEGIKKPNDYFGFPSKEDDCGACGQALLQDPDTDRAIGRACNCSYEQWSEDMHTFWAKNLRLSQALGKGYGVFALSDFDAEQVLGEYTGELVPLDKDRADGETPYFSTIRMGKPKWVKEKLLEQPECSIDATCKSSITRFLNHSCDGNSKFYEQRIGMDRRVLLVSTTKTIAKGEEVTIDYGDEYFKLDEYCLCGSEKCRFAAESDPNVDMSSDLSEINHDEFSELGLDLEAKQESAIGGDADSDRDTEEDFENDRTSNVGMENFDRDPDWIP